MVTCSLSIIGTLLIILSFICCKDLRSRGRQILVHISLMDLGVATFNLVGVAVYFDRFFCKIPSEDCNTSISNIFILPHHADGRQPFHDLIMCPTSPMMQNLCLSQAALSLYFTYGSILWTNSLSCYLYFRILHRSTKLAQYCLYFSYFFCYGMPLLLTMWLLFTGRLGYSPYESSGWCSIILMDPLTKEKDIYVSLFGYNLWILLTFFFIPILSCTVHINVREEAKQTALYRRSDKYTLALQSIDYKFLLIPIIFILLRVWSFIGDVLHLYVRRSLNPKIALALVILGGIGDSGQGISNALLFIFFTKKFKKSVFNGCSKLLKSKSSVNIRDSPGTYGTVNSISKGEKVHNDSSEDRISPHQFTSQSYEYTTPVPLNT